MRQVRVGFIEKTESAVRKLHLDWDEKNYLVRE